jgi:hypothetical protein
MVARTAMGLPFSLPGWYFDFSSDLSAGASRFLCEQESNSRFVALPFLSIVAVTS